MKTNKKSYKKLLIAFGIVLIVSFLGSVAYFTWQPRETPVMPVLSLTGEVTQDDLDALANVVVIHNNTLKQMIATDTPAIVNQIRINMGALINISERVDELTDLVNNSLREKDED